MKRLVVALGAISAVMFGGNWICSAQALKTPTVKNVTALPAKEGVIFRPRIAGDWVLCLENEDGKACRSKQKALYAHNVLSKAARKSFEVPCGWPEASGDWALWTATSPQIEAYLNSNGCKRFGPKGGTIVMLNTREWTYCTPVLPTPSANWPRLSGKCLTWGYGGQIYVADLVTGEWKQVSNGKQRCSCPSAAGGIVTWEENVDGRRQVHVYNMFTGADFAIYDEKTDLIFPETDGQTLVYWQIKVDPQAVWAYDLKTGNRREIAKGACPKIQQGIVVYYKAGSNRIAGFDLATNKEFKISKAPSHDGPTINNGRVVWSEDDNAIRVAELDLEGRPIGVEPLPPPSTWKFLASADPPEKKTVASKPKEPLAEKPKPVIASHPPVIVSRVYKLPVMDGTPFRPRAAGDWVMAAQNEDDGGYQSKQKAFYAYNVLTGETITPFDIPCGWPETSGDWAAWTADSQLIDTFIGAGGYKRIGPTGGSVVLVNTKDWVYCTPVLPTTKVESPAQDGRHLAWTCDNRVYMADLVTGSCKRISTGEQIGSAPTVSGGVLVWEERGEKRRVHAYDITLGTDAVISDPKLDAIEPHTDGKTVVYWQRGASPVVWAYDILKQTTTRIAEGSAPFIDEGVIVYCGADGFAHGFDLLTNTDLRISEERIDGSASINRGSVVWVQGNAICVAELDFGSRPRPRAARSNYNGWKMFKAAAK